MKVQAACPKPDKLGISSFLLFLKYLSLINTAMHCINNLMFFKLLSIFFKVSNKEMELKLLSHKSELAGCKLE